MSITSTLKWTFNQGDGKETSTFELNTDVPFELDEAFKHSARAAGRHVRSSARERVKVRRRRRRGWWRRGHHHVFLSTRRSWTLHDHGRQNLTGYTIHGTRIFFGVWSKQWIHLPSPPPPAFKSISVPLLETASELLDVLIRNLRNKISSQTDLNFYNSEHTAMINVFNFFKNTLLDMNNHSYKSWAEQKNCSILVNAANLSENTNTNTASQRYNSQQNNASLLNNNTSLQNKPTQPNNNGNMRMQNVAETEIKLRKSNKQEMIIILRNMKSSVDHIITLFKKIECNSNLVTKESLRVTEQQQFEHFLKSLVFQLDIYTQRFEKYSMPVWTHEKLRKRPSCTHQLSSHPHWPKCWEVPRDLLAPASESRRKLPSGSQLRLWSWIQKIYVKYPDDVCV